MKKVVVANNSQFELFIPSIEEALKGGMLMQEFNKIKSLRVGAGMTQEEMAKALGMTKPTYASRESNINEWKLSEMHAFIEVINKATGGNYSVKDIFF